ncbi:MAG TPA: LuxR C-terminal-related transcriptional regulator [Acidimicrobiales bacterium]|nr:LuxR C-terminal-related transcriptional regulator [Acidimicrobiales bacterium]
MTVVGPPGVGKSRLAIEVARAAADRTHDGTWLLDVASLPERSRIRAAVADALGHLDPRALLVLDDCDPLGPEVATIVDELLRTWPEIRVLATARGPLGVTGEELLRLQPLSLSDHRSSDQASACNCEAVQLFGDRAAAQGRGFEVTPVNAGDVHELCGQLDGLPLAIELAANWTGALSPGEILDRLDDRFDLLRESASGPERGRSVHRSLVGSYDQLTASEAALFRRLAVFENGCTLGAAEQVCGAGDLAPEDVTRLLAQLANKSLVEPHTSAGGTRFRLLRTIRSFANEQLALARETEWIRDRHAAWCRTILTEAELELRRSQREASFPRLQAEHENLAAGLEWMLESGRQEWALRSAAAMARYWRERRLWGEGRDFLTRALDANDGPSGLRGRALFELGHLVGEEGDYAAALAHLEEGLRLATAAGDSAVVARSLSASGYYRLLLGDSASALSLVERGIDLARRAGDGRCVVMSVATAGQVAMFAGDARRAQGRFAESLAVGADIGEDKVTWTALVGAGWAALVLGAYEEAQAHLEQALAIGRTTVFESAAGVALSFLGELARVQGRFDDAHLLLTEALDLARQAGRPFAIASRLVFMGRLCCAEGEPDRALPLFAESLAQAREEKLPFVLGQSLLGAGLAHGALHDPVEARRCLEEALLVTRRSGDRRTRSAAMVELARLDRRRGGDDKAVRALLVALDTYHEIGDAAGVLDALEALAATRAAQGRYPVAARLLGAAESARRALGSVPPPESRIERDESAAAGMAHMGSEAWRQAWDEGAARSVGEAVAYARRGRGHRSRAAKGWASLTSTERVVAGLVALGLTNQEIASRLLVSVRTVESHVSHVLAKLGLSSRRQVAEEAARRA